MRRTTLVAALFALGLSATPSAAQDFARRPNKPEHEWDATRPDSRAPAGVTMDKLYAQGDFSLAYRFNHLNEEGYFFGSSQVGVDDLLRDFPTVALNTNTWEHNVEVSIGLSDNFTLLGSLPFVVSRADNLTDDFVFYQTESEGLGDVKAAALLGLHNEGAIRSHLSLKASFPTGSVTNSGPTPFTGGSEAALPYTMQTGTGTLDLTPGATLQAQNELGTVGFQTLFTIRMGTNERDYKFGNAFRGNIWGAIQATEAVSASFRFQYSHVADLKGQDTSLDPFFEPGANPLFQSGTRVDLPLGMNIAFPDGPLAGHRITAEYVVPVHHNLNGVQLGANWGLQFRWEALF